MQLPGFLGGKKTRRKKTTKKTRTKKPRRGHQGGFTPLTWILLTCIVVLITGIGLVKWAKSGPGQATMLTLGADKAYPEVQILVERVLSSQFPDFKPGPLQPDHEDMDFDWPVPSFGAGAEIRCRQIVVSDAVPYEQIQLSLDRALRPLGGRVLWGQRLYPDHPKKDQRRANDEKDLLRLDVGVQGKATHTLILRRRDSRAEVRWGHLAGPTAWDRLLTEAKGPVVALVIDDWGYSRNASTSGLLKLPAPFTMAVLPRLSYSRHFALEATDLVLPSLEASKSQGQAATHGSAGRPLRLAAGCPVEVRVGQKVKPAVRNRREVILHLPMEPQDYPENNPGEDPLLVGMTAPEILKLLENASNNVPGFRGLNNHMGSGATSDSATMQALMQVLSEKGLYFVDSLTTSRSVAHDEAKRAGIPTLRNRIFLDYDNENQETITANLNVLVRTARKTGFALGIGHPHPATMEVLRREIPRLQEQGVVFVTVSEMLALKNARASGGSS